MLFAACLAINFRSDTFMKWWHLAKWSPKSRSSLVSHFPRSLNARQNSPFPTILTILVAVWFYSQQIMSWEVGIVMNQTAKANILPSLGVIRVRVRQRRTPAEPFYCYEMFLRRSNDTTFRDLIEKLAIGRTSAIVLMSIVTKGRKSVKIISDHQSKECGLGSLE